jgi:hypothetical protein
MDPVRGGLVPRFVPWTVVIGLTALLLAHGCTCTPTAKEMREQPKSAVGKADGAPTVATATRGMWVWKTRPRLADPAFKTTLLETCRRARLNELYVSIGGGVLEDPHLPELLAALHEAGVRVEALMGEATWYQPERRSPMFALITAVASYNDAHPGAGFAGIHLDIEPHQLPENRKTHDFLPALAETLVVASEAANKRNLSTSADLPRFALEKNGPALVRAVRRPFLMLYELRDKSSERLVATSKAVVDQAYAGLPPEVLGQLVVGVSVDDYPKELEVMLAALDSEHGKLARYGGWAIHDEGKYRARPTP